MCARWPTSAMPKPFLCCPWWWCAGFFFTCLMSCVVWCGLHVDWCDAFFLCCVTSRHAMFCHVMRCHPVPYLKCFRDITRRTQPHHRTVLMRGATRIAFQLHQIQRLPPKNSKCLLPLGLLVSSYISFSQASTESFRAREIQKIGSQRSGEKKGGTL